MRSTFSLSLLFAAAIVLIHCSLSVAAADGDLFLKTCRDSANGDPNVNYDFCVSSLQAFPGSGSADVKGLAVIAARLSLANATSTKAKITELINTNNGGRLMQDALKTCLSLYSDLIGRLPDAIDAIQSSRYGDAQTYLSAALDSPSTCEDSISEMGIKTSPLAKEDKDSSGLIAISLAITASLNK